MDKDGNVLNLDSLLFKMKRNQLICLMRDVGSIWLEDQDFLEDYIVDQVKLFSDTEERLELALICFQNLKFVRKRL